MEGTPYRDPALFGAIDFFHGDVPLKHRGRPAVPLTLLLGVFLGTGLFTLHYAKGLSYLSPDPGACVNCHIMQPQFDSWQKNSHHAVARCVDCHLPHGLLEKYIAKADSGYRHSAGFTLQDFEEPIVLTQRSRSILQSNCLRCHEVLVQGLAAGEGGDLNSVECLHCHRDAGHGEAAGLGRIDQRLDKIVFERGGGS